MATAASRKLPSLGISTEKGNEILGVLLAFLVLFLAASLVSFHPQDPSIFHHTAENDAPVRNWIGPVGAQLAALLFSLLGLGCLLLPVGLGAVAWRRFTLADRDDVKGRGFGVAAVFLALPGMCQLLIGDLVWRGESLSAGGAVGSLLATFLDDKLHFGGAFLVLLTLLLVGGSLVAHTTLGELLALLRERAGDLLEHIRVARGRRSKQRDDEKAHRRVVEHHLERVAAPPKEDKATAQHPRPELDLPNRVITKKGEGHFAFRRVVPETDDPALAKAPPEPEQEKIDFGDEEPQIPELPPVNLLRTDKPKSKREEAKLVKQGQILSRACLEFGVEGSIEGISPGPVITVYELQPAPGVKVSKVVNLQDDLALALKAESVRIDRIPGHSTLGIEVPHHDRSVIHLGNLLANETFRQAKSPLTMAIGVDIHGRPYYCDLATMPHLLVAGATGAGKSVGLQSMITSILYKATREDVQFIFIDPKRIELGVYADIPHLKTEVVMEPKKAANALRWAVAEMERRYRLLAEVHVRSIAYYNRAIRDPKERKRLALKEGDQSEFQAEDLKPLPYYVIVIDELADLMIVAASEVESSIARLAQMARAVGIHLIVATQRPSVDVLTGTIKANFPCRLAYATASRHDSRTILDQIGSEKLLGKGDALFMPPGTSRIMRLHGAYITEQETAALIRWLKRRGKPDLDLDVVKDPDEGAASSGGSGGDDDPLFDEAARLVVKERQASASYLQRRMRVGFSRAARLVDMLEADGLLGPAQGSKPRDVLVPVDYFEEIDAARSD